MDVIRFLDTLSKRTLLSIIFLISVNAYPCQCVLSSEDKSTTELVKEESASSDAIFQGRVKSIENIYEDRLGQRRVTFLVEKSWKLVKVEKVVVWTGMGRGDCGFRFIEGEVFLVYAVGSVKKLETTICHRTRNLGNARSDVKILGEPIWVVPSDSH